MSIRIGSISCHVQSGKKKINVYPSVGFNQGRGDFCCFISVSLQLYIDSNTPDI